jgi:hypothetical protein
MTYRTITKDELASILAAHKEWLKDNSKGQRANLSSADLRYADLRYVDLSSANLSSADLRYADLRYVDLSSANLSSADLRYADLRYADLSSADLLIFQFQQHTAYFTLDGGLRIGCHMLPISEWLIGYKEIGKESGYTLEQIEAYGDFIKLCAKQFALHAEKSP